MLKNPKFYIVFGLILITGFNSHLFYDRSNAHEVPITHHFDVPAPLESKTFKTEFGDNSHIYDGDTWVDMYVLLKDIEATNITNEVLWPGILISDNKIYAMTDIRVYGIDTPEKRPTRFGRTQESLDKEKAAAKVATEAVEQLLEDNDWKFVLEQPSIGKYAGRIVAKILVGDEKIDVADYLINKGLGYRYIGGKKQKFDDWYKGEIK